MSTDSSRERSERETWLTPQEAAAHLRISVPTVYRLTARGELVAYHVGKSRRYRLRDLDALPQRREEAACNA